MAAQVHGNPPASKRVGGHCRGHGATGAAGRRPKPHGSDRVAAASCGGIASAIWLGIAIYNAWPLKCICYLEDCCIKAEAPKQWLGSVAKAQSRTFPGSWH